MYLRNKIGTRPNYKKPNSDLFINLLTKKKLKINV